MVDRYIEAELKGHFVSIEAGTAMELGYVEEAYPSVMIEQADLQFFPPTFLMFTYLLTLGCMKPHRFNSGDLGDQWLKWFIEPRLRELGVIK